MEKLGLPRFFVFFRTGSIGQVGGRSPARLAKDLEKQTETMSEMSRAKFQMEYEKSRTPDGTYATTFRRFWNSIRDLNKDVCW